MNPRPPAHLSRLDGKPLPMDTVMRVTVDLDAGHIATATVSFTDVAVDVLAEAR